LRYQAGGAGSADLPTPAGWSLGRGWSHDYALAIVEDPDPSHVWLITEFATYREFTDGNGDGFYETIVPSDEYRTLEKCRLQLHHRFGFQRRGPNHEL
jgi:hypothetical protein